MMPNEQTTTATPLDSNPVDTDSVFKKSDNFFDNMSAAIDGVPIPASRNITIVGKNEDDTPKASKSDEQKDKDSKVAALETKVKELENISKRYSDSSREGIRLAEENAALKRQIDEVRSPAPKDVFEFLGINKEEFVFDPDEAMKNPASDSARVFKANQALEVLRQRKEIVEEVKAEILGSIRAKEVKETEDSFRSKHGYKDNTKWQEFQDFMKNTPFDLNAANILFTMRDRDENMVKAIMNEATRHKSNLNKIPDTLSDVKENDLLNSPRDLDLEEVLGRGSRTTTYFK